MLSLIYDTETNGLPLWKEPSEHPGQPRITQIACELVDDDTREVQDSMSFLIKPDGWTIPEDLQKLTGITMERAEKEGVPMQEVLPAFIRMWERALQRVAHNESFDMRMVRIELMRHEKYKDMLITNANVPFADFWKGGKAFCTQGNSQKIIKLPATVAMHKTGRHGPKAPNLGEAYKFFTGKELEGAHDAQVDLMACKAVYFGILDHRAKNA
jgi:DNA polymerase-3 subunit epsilon